MSDGLGTPEETPPTPPKKPRRARKPKPPKEPHRLRDRSTGDLLVLLVAGTVCFTVLGSTVTIALSELLHPESDTSAAVRTIAGVINTLIGLLAGFLAGRTDLSMQHTSEGEEPPQ